MTKEELIGNKQIRQKRIGGSEFATVLGINPYKKRIELVLEKAGVIADMFEGNEATRRGEFLENDIIAMFEDETGLSVADEQKEFKYQPALCLELVCHCDGITSDDAIFEAKTTDINAKTWKDGIPEYYKAQLDFNCALGDKKKAYIAVGYCKENEIVKFEWFEYKPQKELNDIIADCQDFTQDVKAYMQKGVVNNGLTVKADIDSKLIQELEDLNNKISEMKAEIKPYEDKKKAIETKLKNLIGCNNAIENDLYRISLGNRITSPSLDYKITRSGIKVEYINENS